MKISGHIVRCRLHRVVERIDIDGTARFSRRVYWSGALPLGAVWAVFYNLILCRNFVVYIAYMWGSLYHYKVGTHILDTRSFSLFFRVSL